jgi:hypothetical protein
MMPTRSVTRRGVSSQHAASSAPATQALLYLHEFFYLGNFFMMWTSFKEYCGALWGLPDTILKEASWGPICEAQLYIVRLGRFASLPHRAFGRLRSVRCEGDVAAWQWASLPLTDDKEVAVCSTATDEWQRCGRAFHCHWWVTEMWPCVSLPLMRDRDVAVRVTAPDEWQRRNCDACASQWQ